MKSDASGIPNNPHDLICAVTPSGYIKQMNDRWCTELGWSEEELRSKPIHSFLKPEDEAPLCKKMQQAVSSEHSCELISTLLKKDGSTLDTKWQLSRREDGLLSVVAKELAQKAFSLNEEDANSNHYLKLTADIARIGYGRLNLLTRQVDWSDTAYAIFGIDPESQIDNYDFFFSLFDASDRPLILSKHEEAIANQTPAEYKAQVRRPDNQKCYIHVHLVCEFDENKQPAAFFYVLQDVTDYEIATRAVEEAASELNYQATHDELTGLGNRRVFERALEKANKNYVGNGRCFALCIIDLDQFKVVNDTCGHAAGDALLQQVASLLNELVSEENLVIRLGGDEFAVIFYDITLAKATDLAEIIRESIDEFIFSWDDQVFRIGASIGVVSVKNQAADTSSIMRAADSACFAAKEAGRNFVYAVEADDEALANRQEQMSWVQRIHAAIDNDDFILYSQPIKSLNGGDQCWEEVLLRMRNREKGTLIPPGAFLPAAERYDLSTKVDMWVVRQLIKTLKAYGYLFNEKRRYWVNLSARSMGDPKFIGFLEQEIRDSSLEPGTLNFEITETAVIRNTTEAVKVMNRFKELGCRFAMDDFGGGVTSFGYLKTLPVDWIKIDGMFVRHILNDEVDRLFVKSIIDIAQAMNIKCVAEFVESQELGDKLRDMGVDFGQGFALGEPSELLPISVVLGSKKS